MLSFAKRWIKPFPSWIAALESWRAMYGRQNSAFHYRLSLRVLHELRENTTPSGISTLSVGGISLSSGILFSFGFYYTTCRL